MVSMEICLLQSELLVQLDTELLAWWWRSAASPPLPGSAAILRLGW